MRKALKVLVYLIIVVGAVLLLLELGYLWIIDWIVKHATPNMP